MTMDGVCLYAALEEIRKLLTDGRIQNVHQPVKEELVLTFRSRQDTKKLLLSASPDASRVHITAQQRENPEHPPVFCMLLRKYLSGARLIGVTQPGLERAADFLFMASDELGDRRELHLIAEIMGKHSNIILTDSNMRIIDSIKHVTAAVSSIRQVLPGLAYTPPPSQGKHSPLDLPVEALEAIFEKGLPLNKALSKCIDGVSASTADEIAAYAENYAGGVTDGVHAFFSLLQSGNYVPMAIFDESGGPSGFFPFQSSLHPVNLQRPFPSFNEALDAYYSSRATGNQLEHKRLSLEKIVNNALEKQYKKADVLRQALFDAAKLKEYSRSGDLIFANIHTLSKGMDKAILRDYETGGEVVIALDERLTPAQNAQAYYKKYTKAKSTAQMAGGQLEKCLDDIVYLEGQSHNIGSCTEPAELDEIRAELEAEGILRKQQRSKRKIRQPQPTKPLHYAAAGGFDIYAGKNNVQNEYLTFRLAHSDDMWLHIKDAPGSHVILKSRPSGFTDAALEAAGIAAAWHSKSRHSSKVAVDYTLRKNVKKIPGGKPGMVTYTSYKTMFITPSEQGMSSLKLSD